jgi:hypothetical protein
VVVTAVVGLEEEDVNEGNMLAGARTVALVMEAVLGLRVARTDALRLRRDSEGSVGNGAGGRGRRGAPEREKSVVVDAKWTLLLEDDCDCELSDCIRFELEPDDVKLSDGA